MDKKKRTRELLVFAAIVIALLILAILVPSGEEGGSIQEVMRDAVLHERFKIALFGLEVNPGLISAYVVTGILIVFALICRIFVIPRFTVIPGKLQLLLEQLVSLFDGLAEGSMQQRMIAARRQRLEKQSQQERQSQQEKQSQQENQFRKERQFPPI